MSCGAVPRVKSHVRDASHRTAQRAHLLQGEVAPHAHRAQVGADLQRLRLWPAAREVFQRGEAQVELVDVVLREAAEPQLAVAVDGARHRLEIAEDELQQRRLPDAVGADERDARVQIDAQVDVLEEIRLPRVVEPDVGELEDR